MYRKGQTFPARCNLDLGQEAVILKVFRLPFGTFFEYEEGNLYPEGYPGGEDYHVDFEADEGGFVDLAEMEEIEERFDKMELEACAYRVDNPVDTLGRPIKEKVCQGCGFTVYLPAEYGFCETCADKREAGMDVGA